MQRLPPLPGVLAQKQETDTRMGQRIGGLRGLGYTLLGWGVEVFGWAYYLCWVLPRTAWLTYTGRIPPRD